jgi:hypothetical protein
MDEYNEACENCQEGGYDYYMNDTGDWVCRCSECSRRDRDWDWEDEYYEQ